MNVPSISSESQQFQKNVFSDESIQWKIASVINSNWRLIEVHNEEARKYLQERLMRNFPAYEMQRKLKHWSSFTTQIFRWVKNLNDYDHPNIHQAFVDRVLDGYKAQFLSYINNWDVHYEAVWDDYKNFVVTPAIELEQEACAELLAQSLKEELWKIWIDEFDYSVLSVLSQSCEVEKSWDLWEDIQFSLAVIRMELEKWDWIGFIDFQKRDIESLWVQELMELEEEYFDNENNIKYSVWFWLMRIVWAWFSRSIDICYPDWILNLKLVEFFTRDDIPKHMKLHDILSQWMYVRDIHICIEESVTQWEIDYSVVLEDWEAYLVTQTQNWWLDRVKIYNDAENRFFNTQIITLVRKKQIPESLALYKKVRAIINMLVADSEFIFPHIEWASSIHLEEYEQVQEAMENNTSINSELLQKACQWYYKPGLSKEWFIEQIQWKSWQLFFVDIKDMGSINIQDFYETLSMQLENEISYREVIQRSWNVMTQKFLSIVSGLKKTFWNDILFQLWGDEIKIFLSYDSEYKASQSVPIMHENIQAQWVFGRITTTKTNWENNEQILSDLDSNTSYSKHLEKIFETIEMRIIHQERTYGREYKKLKQSIEETRELFRIDSVFMLPAFEEMQASLNELLELQRKNKTRLQALRNFYIETDIFWNILKNKLVFPDLKSFNIADIFDSETWKILKNSAFFSFLDNLWLGREKERNSILI